MANWKLNVDNDLDLSTDNLVYVEGLDAIAQDCKTRLKFFLGEWFLDTRLGVPWYQRIIGEKPRLVAIKSILRKAILSTPGLLTVLDFQLDFDRSTRALSLSFRANTVEGEFLYNKELII
jgi:hypothetical protein